MPTVDGLYWLKEKGCPDPQIVLVYFLDFDPTVAYLGTDHDKNLDQVQDGRWYGPLNPPKLFLSS